jgi:hypothetical protein
MSEGSMDYKVTIEAKTYPLGCRCDASSRGYLLGCRTGELVMWWCRVGEICVSPTVWGCTSPAHHSDPLASRSPPLQHHEPTSYLPYTSNTMASNEIPIPRDPTEEEALALFKAVEEKFPSKSLGDDKWYILAV